MGLLSVFKKIGSFLKAAAHEAQKRGLTDEIVMAAKALASQAAQQFEDNSARREWAVQILMSRGIPESIARMAVEMGVQLWKSR